MKYQAQAIWNNSSNVTAIGWGQEEGTDEDTTMWKKDVRPLMEAQKGKKISCLKGYLAAIKRLML